MSRDGDFGEFSLRRQRLRNSTNSRRSDNFENDRRLSGVRPPSRSRSVERTMDIVQSPSPVSRSTTSPHKPATTPDSGNEMNPLSQVASEKPRKSTAIAQKSNSSNELLPSGSKEKGLYHTLPRSRKTLLREIEVRGSVIQRILCNVDTLGTTKSACPDYRGVPPNMSFICV